ncbi:MAG: membrane dipeptidase [Anaerolineae bacterium]|nr:membrane dipeptidase [Anaerolineae bacterium]MDW8173010.1 membrane dipeptidase [Anaerolineae bacterium]
MSIFAQPAPQAERPFFVDAHLDIAWNAIVFGRNPREPLAVRRAREQGSQAQRSNGTSVVSLEDMLRGGVGLICVTLYTGPTWANFSPLDRGYDNAQQANALAHEQLRVYTELLAAEPRLRLIRNRQDLATLRQARAQGQAALGLIVLMEGGDPILSPAQFDEWFRAGVRIVGPAWSATRYSGGTIYHGRGGGPLTNLGRQLLVVMARYSAILDLSHMDESAYLEAVESYQGGIIASHSNPRDFIRSTTNRHLSDAMIRKLAARGGVMGLVAFNAFLHANRDLANQRHNTPISRYVDTFAYVADLLGTTDNLGIGTDWDGGFGLERVPQGLDSHADFPRLAEALSARGYSDEQVRGIMGGNFLRLFERALPSV